MSNKHDHRITFEFISMKNEEEWEKKRTAMFNSIKQCVTKFVKNEKEQPWMYVFGLTRNQEAYLICCIIEELKKIGGDEAWSAYMGTIIVESIIGSFKGLINTEFIKNFDENDFIRFICNNIEHQLDDSKRSPHFFNPIIHFEDYVPIAIATEKNDYEYACVCNKCVYQT